MLDDETINLETEYKIYQATCYIASVRVALLGLREKASTGAELGELEMVGLDEILGASMALLESL